MKDGEGEMKIEKGEAYAEDKSWWQRLEVLVSEVVDGRIYYWEITGWNYGSPFLGIEGSTTLRQFPKRFPNRIEMVQAP